MVSPPPNSKTALLELWVFTQKILKNTMQTFVANYAQINIIPEIKRIPGVGSASIFGGIKDYSMRVWLDPTKWQLIKLPRRSNGRYTG
jgi:multidrug efflux pump subunit AcrB